MKKVTVLIALSIVFLTIGCTETPKQADHNEHATTEMSHNEHAHEDEANKAATVQLDNGKKWVANVETTEGVQKMIVLVDTYLTNKSTDSKGLQENLKKEFTTIFEKCTMKGESHNQLHNFLLPLKDRLDKLADHADAETLGELKTYLSTYSNYFQ